MRTTLLIAAQLLAAQTVFASTLPSDAPIAAAAAAPAAKPAPAATPKDDDEEDEPAPAATPAPAPAAPAAMGEVTTTAPSADAQKLVSGAPLYNPNVAVHIVEEKSYSDRGHVEVALFPAILQVNGKFTQHYGLGGSVIWHLQENFGIMAMGLWNYVAAESSFNAELIDKVRAEAQAATSLLMIGGALVGVEAMPFYGKFAFYDNTLVHFSVVLNGGAGAGMTRHQLKPANDAGPATFGDTGWRFMAEIGGGFRIKFNKWVAIRLELRDVLYTARVDSVNGCNNADLSAMDRATRNGMSVKTANVSGGCNVDRFDGTDDNGRKNSDDVPLAFALVKTPSSDVLNNLGLYLGASVNF